MTTADNVIHIQVHPVSRKLGRSKGPAPCLPQLPTTHVFSSHPVTHRLVQFMSTPPCTCHFTLESYASTLVYTLCLVESIYVQALWTSAQFHGCFQHRCLRVTTAVQSTPREFTEIRKVQARVCLRRENGQHKYNAGLTTKMVVQSTTRVSHPILPSETI